MTVFRPFTALRYAAIEDGSNNIDDLIAPPYDVLTNDERAALEQRSRLNSVRLDYPHGVDDPAAYAGARTFLDAWLAAGDIVVDDRPSFSLYRMTATDEGGMTRQTTGVLGGLGLEPPGTGDVLPHEETTSKDKADRLNLIRATQINTSPIWGLSLADGLGTLLNSLADATPPIAVATDGEDVLHEIWRIDEPSQVAAIRRLCESTPVVIADGHHRFETGLAYLKERGENPGDATRILALLVELAEDQLVVRAIHRLVTLPKGITIDELFSKLALFFEIIAGGVTDASVTKGTAAEGFLTLITRNGTWSLKPIDAAFQASVSLDSTRLRVALAQCAPDADVRYQHSVKSVLGSVEKGDADFGVLLRPATVAQIRVVAHDRTRMPAKTTFFWPKPRTGMVFRSVT